MNIWLLTTEYPPFYGGGIGTYCRQTARMFSSFGHDITVFINEYSTKRKTVSITFENNVRVIRYPFGYKDIYQVLGNHAALSYDLSEIIEEFIRQEGAPDIIECQDYLGIGYFLLQKKKVQWSSLVDVPIVITLHSQKFVLDKLNRENSYILPNFWTGEMEKFSILAADYVISPSKYMLDYLSKEIDLSKVQSSIIPHPFEPTDHSQEDCEENIKYQDMIFLGRVQYLKGVDHLISYLSDLWDQNVMIPLNLIGGTESYYLPKKIKFTEYLSTKYKKYFEKNLIVFEGALPPDKLSKRIKKSHVVICPSLFESFSYAVIEAMSLGKVVIASNSGGPQEIISEKENNGFIFSHNDSEQFILKLSRVLNMTNEEIETIGRNAKEHIKFVCSYKIVYQKKIKVLEKICDSNKGRAHFSFFQNHEKRKCIFPFIRQRQKHLINIPDYQEEKGLLSIIVPYYNMKDYIKETVENLATVKYPQKEIIIVNDGSDRGAQTDILYQIEKMYPVKLIHTKDCGLASTRNKGALQAKGEYLAFLDADDLIEPVYYDWAISILKAYENVSFVGCWTKYFGAIEGLWPTWNPEPPYLLLHNTVNSSSLVLKRKDFIAAGLNDLKLEYLLEDYESVVNMVDKGYMGITIPHPLFYYRIRTDSMMRQYKADQQALFHQYVAEKHQALYQEYAVDIFNLLNTNGPGTSYDNPTLPVLPVG